MHKFSKYLITALLLLSFVNADCADKTVSVTFYNETLTFEYASEIILPGLLISEDISLREYFEKMQKMPYQSFLKGLVAYKEKYELNDWLFYELLKTTINNIYLREDPLKNSATIWFFLTKSGYDTRLTYLDNNIFIYVWSEEDIFETPMILDEGKTFINLSCIHSERVSLTQLNLLAFKPGQSGKPFSFKLEKLPKLSAQIANREIEFMVKERTYRIVFNTDATLFEIMKNYPAFGELEYFNVPMSSAIHSTLISKLEFMIQGKTTNEALGILIGFTRTGFEYKDDKEIFGKSKPMIAEELFHYQYSDCEDRSALFYYLVKEILDLPMLIIAYPDHLSIAIASSQIKGLPFHYEGREYYVCDPTGPVGSEIIGVPPNGYENIPFEVLGTYPK